MDWILFARRIPKLQERYPKLDKPQKKHYIEWLQENYEHIKCLSHYAFFKTFNRPKFQKLKLDVLIKEYVESEKVINFARAIDPSFKYDLYKKNMILFGFPSTTPTDYCILDLYDNRSELLNKVGQDEDGHKTANIDAWYTYLKKVIDFQEEQQWKHVRTMSLEDLAKHPEWSRTNDKLKKVYGEKKPAALSTDTKKR